MAALNDAPAARGDPQRRIPVSLITGFLGGGKTTLLRRMLADPALARSAVIVNEYGDTDFNDVTLARSAPEIMPVNAGCLCCTGRARLAATLAGLERRAGGGLDRVLIETSGLSDPAPVLQVLINDQELVTRYRVDTVIAVIDAVVGMEHLDEHGEARRQVALADRIVVSKTDVADEREICMLEARLRTLNDRAPLLRAVDGDVPPSDLLWSLSDDDGRRMAFSARSAAAPSPHAAVRTWTIRRSRPATETGLALWMDLMAAYRGREVLRMKGIVNVDGKPRLVESIRHVFHPPLAIERWPDDDHDTRVVVIAQNIDRDGLEKSFDALDFEPLERSLDPQAYARFLDLVRGLRSNAAR
jgi:G3E family GTPase